MAHTFVVVVDLMLLQSFKKLIFWDETNLGASEKFLLQLFTMKVKDERKKNQVKIVHFFLCYMPFLGGFLKKVTKSLLVMGSCFWVRK